MAGPSNTRTKRCPGCHGDRAVQSFVTAELDTGADTHHWIGLSNTGADGAYTWTSGQQVIYTAWNSNYTGREDLLGGGWDGGGGGGWG